MTKLEYVRPEDIEKRSFEIISGEIRERGVSLEPEQAPVIMRVIHTTADFDYLDNLKFSQNAVESALNALKAGAYIVTDTNMALSGINKAALARLGCEAFCFMADPDVAKSAKDNGTTRACASAEKAAGLKGKPLILVSGNAPTFLIRARELIDAGELSPALVIAMPVGFVNVVQSKELIIDSGREYIAACGRKGGSNAAAAVVNALMYMLTR
ncbi:MAG: precorrin-8X methylmutase [Oscillospiraceae bacterium]|nr:precorrin-8X methylmutase [Oscillospiraceae bacterium]